MEYYGALHYQSSFWKIIRDLTWILTHFWQFLKRNIIVFCNTINVVFETPLKTWHESWFIFDSFLSEGFWVRPAKREVVKIKFFDFSYWALSTPWRHVLSLKTFCGNPALSWAIRYSVFQNVKFTSSFEFVCGNPFSTFWHLMVKFGFNMWF